MHISIIFKFFFMFSDFNFLTRSSLINFNDLINRKIEKNEKKNIFYKIVNLKIKMTKNILN